jgi:hypothetical protein
MGYQDFCKRFDGVSINYDTDEEPFFGCYGNSNDENNQDNIPSECAGCDNDCSMCHYNERDV